jgi:uncharacterized protein
MVIIALFTSACGSAPQVDTPAATSVAAAATAAPEATSAPMPTEAPRPTPTPTARVTTIDAMYVTENTKGEATGGLSSVKIKLDDGDGHVAFAEDGPQATGNQWQSAGWTAVLLGSLLNGSNPNQYDFSFTSNGRIDGPSAGGLMTVGVLAALRGAHIKDDATMTGTINPDGTIGPVGGIPHKIEGAAKAGKKMVLVPIGQRYDMDENTKQQVDLVEVGRKNGVDVREVGTVFEAYQQLTGDTLPEPSTGAGSPAFPQQAADRLRAGALNLLGTYQKERAQVEGLSEDARTPFNDYIQYADDQAAKVDQSLKQGLFAVAYDQAYTAAGTMRQVNSSGTLLERYIRDGLPGALSQLEASRSVLTQLEAEVNSLQAKKIATASDAVTVFDAYSEIAIGTGKVLLANQIYNDLAQNGSSYDEDTIFTQIFEASRLYTEAGDSVQLAEDASDIGLGFGKSKAPTQEQIQQVAKNMQLTADANLTTFESIFVEPAAESVGMSASAFRAALANKEPLYNLAKASDQGISVLMDVVGGEDRAGALVFGHSQTKYTLASMLVAKYYSLGAELDDNLDITSYDRTKALGEMLEFADKRARELIGQAGDEVPMRALYYFENAQQLRQSGDPTDKLNALSYYWQASLLSQMSSYMADQE